MITISEKNLPQATRTLLEEASLTTGIDVSTLCTQLIIWLSDRVRTTKRELIESFSKKELEKLKQYAAQIAINQETDIGRAIERKARRDGEKILEDYADILSDFALLYLILNAKTDTTNAITATAYAKKHRISRQYICRQIAEGKIKATQRIRGRKKVWQIQEETNKA